MDYSVASLDHSFTRPNVERIDPTYDNIYLGMSDDEFSIAVDQQISRANAELEKLKLKEKRAVNLKYWQGDQVDGDALREDLEKSVENVIFRNLEVMIPIITSRVPEPTFTPAYKNEATRAFAKTQQRIAQSEWAQQDMGVKVGQGVRNHQMNYVAIFQLGFDPETREVWTEEIVATDCVFNKAHTFLARYIKDKTLGDLCKMFPEKRSQILAELGHANGEPTEKILASEVTYIEAWTPECVGFKLNGLVLGLIKNPHWDYVGEVKPVMGPGGMPMVDGETSQVMVTKTVYNHFKKPQIPFLFMNYYTTGMYAVDETTLIDQGIGPQDQINKRKRQIGMNADSTNGHWVSSGDYISQEEFQKIQGGVDEKIWLQNGMPGDGLVKITGEPLPDYIYNDLLDSRQALNDLMGTNDVTRGVSGTNKTLGQDVMQRDQNYGRMDGYVRNCVERFAKQWFEMVYHFYLVYMRDEMAIAVEDDFDLESETIIFSRQSVPTVTLGNGEVKPIPLRISVKANSTLPEDDVTNYNKVQLMKDVLNPLDYYKGMGMANPRELYKNFLIYQTDPMYLLQNDPEIQQLQMAMQQKAIAQQQAQAQAQQQQLGQQAQLDQAKSQQQHQQSLEAQQVKQQGDAANAESQAILQALIGAGAPTAAAG